MTKENKSGSNFPNLRFPGFKGEWKVLKLGDISERVTKKNKENNQNVLTISAQYGLINQMKFFTKSVSSKDLTGYYILERGDFAYNKSYSNGYPMGAIKHLVNYDKGIVSTLYICFRFSNEIDKSFAQQFFESGKQNVEIEKIAQEGARNHGLLNIGVNDFFNIKLNLPVLNEQEKIASFLCLLDKKIAAQKKIIEGISLQKISIVKKLFENKINFKTDNKTQNWERKKLSEISKEHLHKNPDNKYNEVFSVAKHKGVINQIEHLGRSFSAKEILHYKLVYPGDLVYTKSPTSNFPFGIIKQNRTGRIGVVSPLYCVFTPKTYALGYLLHEYFNSAVNTFNYLNPLVQKGAKNTMNINNEIFLNGASILLPMNEEEQQKIYKFLLAFDKKINLENELLTQYENQKKYLLQNLFV